MVDFHLASGSDLKKEVLRVQLHRRPRLRSRKVGLRARLIASAPYALIFAVGAFLYRTADQIEFDQVEGRIGPDLWPKLIIILMMVACVWGAIKAALLTSGEEVGTGAAAAPSADTSKIEEQDEPDTDDIEIYPLRVWGTIAATIAYLFFMPYAGFFLSSALFIAAVVYLGGYRKIVPVLSLSLAGSLFFMTIFIRVVYVSLPIGIEPFDRVSLALIKIINL